MFNNDTLRTVALEILKTKYDLKNLTTEQILNHYFNIWKDLKEADKELPVESLGPINVKGI